jgi:hypothetical protein
MSGNMTPKAVLEELNYKIYAELKASLSLTDQSEKTRRKVEQSVKSYELDNEESTLFHIGQIMLVGLKRATGSAICYFYGETDKERSRSKVKDGMVYEYFSIQQYSFKGAMKKAQERKDARIHKYFHKALDKNEAYEKALLG